MKAKAEPEYFTIQNHETLPNGVNVIILPLGEGVTFSKLPQVISYEGRLYGKTGWNSDRQVCYYRDDAHIAKVS